jgi:dTDP-glucose pyrophosphorylase
MKERTINILVPMAGKGSAFTEAGYTFPKPLIDVDGRTMIELVIDNLRPKVPHKFIFVLLREQYDMYDFYNIFKNATGSAFEVVTIANPTQGAAVTALAAIQHIDTDEELIVANADQYLDCGIDGFIQDARKKKVDGHIMTFTSSHPKWSYARVDKNKKVIETQEKTVISNHATVGVYYYKKGSILVEALKSMIKKDVRHNNEFYICPAFNEMILGGKNIRIYEINADVMHGMGTPEDLKRFQQLLEEKKRQKKHGARKTTKRKK